MRCRQCGDMHSGDGLAVKDKGISFGLGDCKGEPHDWEPARLIIQLPMVGNDGLYRYTKIDKRRAKRFVGGKRYQVTSLIANGSIARTITTSLDGVQIPFSTKHPLTVYMDPGDKALVPILDQSPEKPCNFAILERVE